LIFNSEKNKFFSYFIAIILITLLALPGLIFVKNKWFQITDILSLFFLLSGSALFFFKNLKSPKFLFLLLLIFLYFSMQGLLHFIFNEVPFLGVLIPLKISALIILTIGLFSLMKKKPISPKIIYLTTLLIVLAQTIFLIFQFITNTFYGFYFVGVLGGIGASHTGYILVSILQLILFFDIKYFSNILNKIIIFILLIFLGLTISRIGIICGILSVAYYLFVLIYKKKNYFQVFLTLLTIILLPLIAYPFISHTHLPKKYENISRLFRFFNNIDSTIHSGGQRTFKWKAHYKELTNLGPSKIVFGKGSNAQINFVGIHGDPTYGTGVAVDNLFMRIFWNFGLIGITIFLVYFIFHLKDLKTYKNHLFSLAFINMFGHGLTHEMLFVGKSVDIFLLFSIIGITMNSKQNKKKLIKK
jgi:hypothetical protein